MKKVISAKSFVSGIIVGALLFAGTSVFADAAKSLFGKKVDGVYEVYYNGKRLNDAPTIAGSSYLPVRSLSDAAGISVNVEGKKISLTKQVTEVAASTSTDSAAVQAQINNLTEEIKWFNFDIENTEKSEIPSLQKNIEEETARTEKLPGRLEGLQKNLKDRQDYVTSLKAKVTEAQAKIDALKAQLNK
ncbi:hypothetical protein D3C87_1172990 [compost metagenome]